MIYNSRWNNENATVAQATTQPDPTSMYSNRCAINLRCPFVVVVLFAAGLFTTVADVAMSAPVSAQQSRNFPGVRRTLKDLETELAARTNAQILETLARILEEADRVDALRRGTQIAEILEQRKDWNRAKAARDRIVKYAAEENGTAHWTTRFAVELREHTRWLSKLEDSKQVKYLKLRKRVLHLEDWMEQNPWDIDTKREAWEQIAKELNPIAGGDQLMTSIVSLRHLQTVLAQSKTVPKILTKLQQMEKLFQKRLGASPWHAQCHHLISRALELKNERGRALRHSQRALNSYNDSGIGASDIQFNFAAIHMAKIGFVTGQIPQAKRQLQLVIEDCRPHGFLQQMVCAEAYFRLAMISRTLGDGVQFGEQVVSAAIMVKRETKKKATSPKEATELNTHYMERLGGLREMGRLAFLGGKYEQARKYHATDAKNKLDRNINPVEIAYALRNLAAAEIQMGTDSLKQADEHIEQARRLLEDLETHRDLRAALLAERALIAEKQNDLSKALKFHRAIIEHFRNKKNPLAMRHATVIRSVRLASELEWKMGRKSQAFNTCLEFLNIRHQYATDLLPRMPVELATKKLLSPLWRGTENLLAMADAENTDSLKRVLEWAFTSKGLATETEKRVLIRIRKWARSRDHARLVNELCRKRSEIVHVLLHDSRRLSKREARIRAIQSELDVAHNRLLNELNTEQEIQQLRLSKFSIERLLRRIPANTAYVDFWTAREPNAWTTQEEFDDSRTLVAMLVWKPSEDESAKIRLVRLGSYSEIRREIREWQSAFASLERLAFGRPPEELERGKMRLRKSSERLHSRLWLKIAPHIGEMERVVISPVEALWQIPFAALLDPDTKQYLIARQQIAFVHNARQFLQILETPIARTQNPLVVGGLDYGRAEQRKNELESTFAFQELEHSMGELESVSREQHGWTSVRRMSARMATESEVVVALSNPKHDLAHFATHAFSLKMDKQFDRLDQNARKAITGLDTNLLGAFMGSHLRQRRINAFSGIVLSGANEAELSDSHDQILSAEEIELLDLSHLRFVAISGCNSSRGSSSQYQHEGVFGLQRSLYLAGVHSSLGSLWEVDDRQTKNLMERFYVHVRQSGKASALAQAQRELYQSGEPIAAWAGWQIFGDWR